MRKSNIRRVNHHGGNCVKILVIDEQRPLAREVKFKEEVEKK